MGELQTKISEVYFVSSLSHVQLSVTPQTVAYEVPPSMGFPRREYWSGWPFPSPGDLPDPGIEPRSPALQADAFPSKPPGKPLLIDYNIDVYKQCRVSYKKVKLKKLSGSFRFN